jgi:hypothetical protein
MSGLKSYGLQPLPPAPSAESVPAGVAGSVAFAVLVVGVGAIELLALSL